MITLDYMYNTSIFSATLITLGFVTTVVRACLEYVCVFTATFLPFLNLQYPTSEVFVPASLL